MNKYALTLPLLVVSVFLDYIDSVLTMEHIYAIATLRAVFGAACGYVLFFKRFRKPKQNSMIPSERS